MTRKALNYRAKKFGQLNDTDSIYYISPVTQQVEGFKIKEIVGASPEQIRLAPSLKTWVKIEVYHNVFALQSPDIEKIPTVTFLFNGTEHAQMAVVKVAFSENNQPQLPVLFFADIRLAETWKAQG